MKTLLMHPDRAFDATPPEPGQPLPFAQDIELNLLLNTAAAGDRYLFDIMTAACAEAWTNDLATICYRQEILKDCLTNPSIVRRFYAIASEPFEREKSWNFTLWGHDASSRVASGVRTLQGSLGVLARLRPFCSSERQRFASEGFQQFFDTIEHDLDDGYLAAAQADLTNLTFRRSQIMSALVGDGGKGERMMLRKPQPRDESWLRRTLTPGARSFTLQLQPRDDAGAQAFVALRNRGLDLISDAIYQSAEHVLDFIKTLRAELAFYMGCLNLKEGLDRIGETVTFPTACAEIRQFACRNLRDVCLTLALRHPAVGNDVGADGRGLVVITGANRGGKSTFLRSVGLAQLMLQCGMFVTADAFHASVHTSLFTHYKREEDRSMQSGKFDEELVRMNTIAEHIHRRALILFNESFAATHEQEGSEIARQIVSALLENDVSVFFVSHMYEFARAFLDDPRALFLRAEREADGGRSFRLHEARPEPKSFGVDLYKKIFGETDEARVGAGSKRASP